MVRRANAYFRCRLSIISYQQKRAASLKFSLGGGEVNEEKFSNNLLINNTDNMLMVRLE